MISVSKGMEEKTLKRMSEIIVEELRVPMDRVVVLSGPSHAEEVCRRQPTAVVAAGRQADTVKAPCRPFFRRITSASTRKAI